MSKTENETPTLEKAINDLIDNKLANAHTCLPGIVKTYDPSTKRANIQPALKRKYIDGNLVSLPIIPNVPVGFMQTQTSIISVPVKPGDDVLIIFSERSIDNWKTQGGEAIPDDVRKFNLSDAFAIPIVKPLGAGLAADPGDAIRIENILSLGRFHEDGQIKFENPNASIDIGADGTITSTNAIATQIIAPDGTVTITNTNGSLVLSPAGTITFTTPAGTMTMGSNGSVNITTPNAELDMDVAGKVEIGKSTATIINLGAGTEPVLLGTTATTTYDGHTHTYNPGGGGATQTGSPSNSLASSKSAKVNTE